MSRSNKTPNKTPTAVAIGTALAGGLLLSGSAFAMTPLAQGYLLGAQEAATTAGDKAHEGRCGMERVDSDGDGRVSRDEFQAAHPDKADTFAEIDANGDGFIDAAEKDAHHGDKGDMEGKCGEGQCGGAV
ncbi:EF-hand domain-containing protein [Luteimonas sp. SJ-92]|uniref:EF-hand domain-containing protein n=1 Tax=Luteimonas salinisoli TaxID=2752307 RepID=A0A853JBN9_9GAMM|nr:EF-hand domain-containing protein [Luteimonas salinisoli]NZA26020.1 EF-hand domain-containing protein [Luteimonas salinisoli]